MKNQASTLKKDDKDILNFDFNFNVLILVLKITKLWKEEIKEIERVFKEI